MSKTNRYTTWLCLAVLAFLWWCPARGESHYVAVGRLSFDETEDEYKADKDFYNKYCAPTDEKIASAYYDQWRYHEMQVPYLGASWNYQHLSNTSLDSYIHPQYEGSAREQFAQSVLRMRSDSFLRAYFAPANLGTIKHAQESIAALKDHPIALSNAPDAPKLHMGYDLFSDSFKAEYENGTVSLGLYHPRMLATIGSVDSLSMKLSAKLGFYLPTWYITCPFSAGLLETGLSRDLTPTLSTQLVADVPVGGPVLGVTLPSTYQVRFLIRF